MHNTSKDHCSPKYDVPPLRQRLSPFPRYSRGCCTHYLQYEDRRYGILGFNVPLDTVQVISETEEDRRYECRQDNKKICLCTTLPMIALVLQEEDNDEDTDSNGNDGDDDGDSEDSYGPCSDDDDDEETLLEQEQHEQSVDHSAEIAALQEEGLNCYHAGCGVVRIDPLHFLARCRKRPLNHALSLSYLFCIRFFSVLLFIRPLFMYRYFALVCVLSFGCSGCQYLPSDWLERLL